MAIAEDKPFGMHGRGIPGPLVFDEPFIQPVQPRPAEPPAEPAVESPQALPGELPSEPAVELPPAPEAPAYDPSEHTVSEVVDYALGCTPEEVAEIRRLEAAGKNRSTLLAELDQLI